MEKEHKIPSTYEAIAGALTVALFITIRLLERGENQSLRWLGVGCLLLGGVLLFPPLFAMRKYGRPDPQKGLMHTTEVVERGPFALVRHPQYVSYMLLNLGFTLISQRWPAVALGAAAILFFILQAMAEEKQLAIKFGERYRNYCRRVPRFNLPLGMVRYVRRRRR